jgi:FkbM family methyltransferase
VRVKLATLTALEGAAAVARRLRLGSVVDALAPRIARPFERFELDVDGVRLRGETLEQLHYVRELAEQGREQTFVSLLHDAVPEGGTVLEGGAHLGLVTVHAARAAGPGGRVVVFEPNRAVHGVLRENLEANGVAERVEVRPQALGETAGAAPFFLSGDTSSLFAGNGVAEQVEVVRADDAVSGAVDVIKLDVEGAELAALRGMERLAGRARAMFLECHPEFLRRAGTSPEELVAWIEQHGFAAEWIDEESGRTRPLSEPWTDDYVNLVCRRR